MFRYLHACVQSLHSFYLFFFFFKGAISINIDRLRMHAARGPGYAGPGGTRERRVMYIRTRAMEACMHMHGHCMHGMHTCIHLAS